MSLLMSQLVSKINLTVALFVPGLELGGISTLPDFLKSLNPGGNNTDSRVTLDNMDTEINRIIEKLETRVNQNQHSLTQRTGEASEFEKEINKTKRTLKMLFSSKPGSNDFIENIFKDLVKLAFQTKKYFEELQQIEGRDGLKEDNVIDIQERRHVLRDLKDLKEQYETEKLRTEKAIDDFEGYQPIWAILNFAIMLCPGLFVGFYAIFSKGFMKNTPLRKIKTQWFRITLMIIGVLLTFMFPIGLIAIQVFEVAILVYSSRDPIYQDLDETQNMLETLRFIAEMTVAIEAFFESVPQIILQKYIICFKGEATETQEISMVFSFFMLAKTTILYDLMYNRATEERKLFSINTLKYVLAVLPLYLTSIVFKVGSISLFCMFFGIGTLVILLPLVFTFFVIASTMGFSIRDSVILSFMNLSVVSLF